MPIIEIILGKKKREKEGREKKLEGCPFPFALENQWARQTVSPVERG